MGQWSRGCLQRTAPKTPFGSSPVVCQHQDSPQLPLSETIPPPTSNTHFLELGGGHLTFVERRKRQCAWLECGRRPHFYNGRNCGENPEEDKMLSSPDMGKSFVWMSKNWSVIFFFLPSKKIVLQDFGLYLRKQSYFYLQV